MSKKDLFVDGVERWEWEDCCQNYWKPESTDWVSAGYWFSVGVGLFLGMVFIIMRALEFVL